MNRHEKEDCACLCIALFIIGILFGYIYYLINGTNGICLIVEETPINYTTTSSSGAQYYNIEFIAKYNKDCETNLENETDIRHFRYIYLNSNLAGKQMFDNIMNAYNQTIQFPCRQKIGAFNSYYEDEIFKCE